MKKSKQAIPTHENTTVNVGSCLLAVDPGLRQCGVAVFRPDGVLWDAGLVKNPAKKERGPKAWAFMGRAVQQWIVEYFPAVPPSVVLVERQVIQMGRTRNPADILELAGAAGAVSALYPHCAEVGGYIDEEWKGNLQGDAVTKMILRRLTAEERVRLVIEDHNVIDAIGIGLFFFGRFNVNDPIRVIAR